MSDEIIAIPAHFAAVSSIKLITGAAEVKHVWIAILQDRTGEHGTAGNYIVCELRTEDGIEWQRRDGDYDITDLAEATSILLDRASRANARHLPKTEPVPTDPGPDVLRVLDLSTAHLPEDLGGDDAEILGIDGVTVQALQYGYLLYVPADIDEWLANYGPDEIPEVIVNIWRFAKQHDCGYVMFDSDASKVRGLPTWDW